MSQMDRVITISYTLPPESSPVNEDTKLSQPEEDALLKCSEAESRVSERAYACIKNLKQVRRALLLGICCYIFVHPLLWCI